MASPAPDPGSFTEPVLRGGAISILPSVSSTNTRMNLRIPALTLLLLTATACSRKPAPLAAGRGEHPYTRPAVTLVSGIGNSDYTIETTSPEAQRFFNQGLDYVYAFNFDEAKRSFARAAELDPRAPMPWWGIALAVGPNYNDLGIGPERRKEAFDALTKARSLAAGPLSGTPATPAARHEQDTIEALAQRYAKAPDHLVQPQQYARVMATLSARYPDDLDAATLYAESMMELNAWNLYTAKGAPRLGTPLIVRTLQSVLARDPDHVGANHLLIHAVEASSDPRQGLASAGRLPALAPAAGHLVHMPSHIDQRIGDFAGSAHANQQAILVDDAYYRSQNNPPIGTLAYDSYRVHNMYFLVAGCNMEGNDACSQQAARNLGRYVAPAVPSGDMNPWFLVSEPWMLVRFNHWKRILGAPQPPPGLPGSKTAPPVLTAMWLYARACALAATGPMHQVPLTPAQPAPSQPAPSQPGQIQLDRAQIAQAQAAHDALVRAGRALPAGFPYDFGTPASPIYTLAGLVSQARMDEAAGKRAEAIVSLRQAVALQDRFGYSEPPDWYYPVRESLGGALLRDGQAKLAETVFRQDLLRNAGNGRSLFGLWQALLAQHRDRDAANAEAAFHAAWSHADTSLSVANL
jgi:tetratricopeptide (TPR) repeat protein